MATTNNTYTLLEGTTSTGGYGRLELRLSSTPNVKKNYSEITADLYFIAENQGSEDMKLEVGSGGSGYFRCYYVRDDLVYYTKEKNTSGTEYGDFVVANTVDYQSDDLLETTVSTDVSTTNIAPGATKEVHIASEEVTQLGDYLRHNLDGTLQIKFVHNYTQIWDITNNKGATLTTNIKSLIVDVPKIDRAVIPVTADNFTDEGNPTFSYEATTGESKSFWLYKSKDLSDYVGTADTITSLQAGLSFDGTTMDVAYRNIPTGSTAYTFSLTEAEREILRQKAQGSPTVPIYYMTKVVRKVEDTYTSSSYTDMKYSETVELVSKVQRNLTVIGCNPSLAPTVVDIKPETLALTGDENTVVKYESMVEYAVNATASKHAEIVSQSVTCGSKTITGLPYGVIDDVESELFVFKATDSRNLTAEATVQKNVIDYVKPTCYQKLSMEMAGEFDTRVVLKVSGNYYNGSFGAVDNELKLEVRHTQNDGSMGDWVELTDGLIPTFNGNTYELEVTISGFTYSQAYTFQCRATDKLNYVQSAQYTLRIYPVFDWGENDFNFNVPIQMNGETVLRHNADANNTVLSASGGHIYIRPGGTDDTSGETIIYPDGSIKFGGTVTFADGSTGTGGGSVDLDDYYTKEEVDNLIPETPTAADYVIETGTEAMGSNGTWYWTKWASGKAECYGVRNYGNMACTSTWGSLYMSNDYFTQALPTDLFNAAPDYIDMNLHHVTGGGYGWVIGSSSGDAPTATATGAFRVIRATSATIQQAYIAFKVIGRWK